MEMLCQRGRVCCLGNLRILSEEEKKSSKKKKQKTSESNYPFPHITCAFSPASPHSHLTLLIYLHNYLFTFLFKIYAYKCVYKLKDNFIFFLSLSGICKERGVGDWGFSLHYESLRKGSTEHCVLTMCVELCVWAIMTEYTLSHVCVFCLRQTKIWPVILVPRRGSVKGWCLHEFTSYWDARK